MKFDKVFIIPIIISLLLHFLLLLPLHQKDSVKPKEEKPIEVEILPKKDKTPPPQINENIAPDNDDRQTTLEHDVSGVPKYEDERKTSENRSKSNDVAPPKEKVLPHEPLDIELPKVDNKNYDIHDTKDITERIANEGLPKATGEDTASYNIFEQRYASYFSKLRRQVYQVWTYPRNSIMRGESGIVVASFSILKDGSIVNIKILQSSGYAELDREVMRTLKTLGKTPLPSSYELEQLNISEATFIYTMGGQVERYLR